MKLKNIILLFIICSIAFCLYTWLTKDTMTFRQALLKKMYSVIMLPGKLFGNTSAVQYNLTNSQPVESLYNLSFTNINGDTVLLSSFKNKKMVLVNTASSCGYTGQLAELEQLHQQFSNKVVVIAFPANDFKNQETGSNEEINAFCQKNYGVTFLIAAKTQVIKGKNQHPIFHWLSNPKENGWCSADPVWNFCKYVIDENGVLTHFFHQTVSPIDNKFLKAIE